MAQTADHPLVVSVNELLIMAGITNKRIRTLEHLRNVASSLVVAVYEKLFHARIPGIKRSPKTRDDYVNNAQKAVNALGEKISMPLTHINGRKLVGGDLKAIGNFCSICRRIASITGQDSISGGGEFNDDDANIFVQQQHNEDESISTLESSPIGSSPAPYYNDGERRREEGENAMLRRIYGGLLRKVNSWSTYEQLEAAQKIRRLKADYEGHLQSLRDTFDDRYQRLCDQLANTHVTGESQDRAQKRARENLSGAYRDRQRRMQETQLECLYQRRQQELRRGREANKVFKLFARVTAL